MVLAVIFTSCLLYVLLNWCKELTRFTYNMALVKLGKQYIEIDVTHPSGRVYHFHKGNV